MWMLRVDGELMTISAVLRTEMAQVWRHSSAGFHNDTVRGEWKSSSSPSSKYNKGSPVGEIDKVVSIDLPASASVAVDVGDVRGIITDYDGRPLWRKTSTSLNDMRAKTATWQKCDNNGGQNKKHTCPYAPQALLTAACEWNLREDRAHEGAC